MGLLSFMLGLALPRDMKLSGWLILAGFLAIEEFSQRFFQHRTSDWFDLASSLARVTVFSALNWRLTAPKGKSLQD
jgi:hypothetical protein